MGKPHTDESDLVHLEEADVVKELYAILPSGQRRTVGVENVCLFSLRLAGFPQIGSGETVGECSGS